MLIDGLPCDSVPASDRGLAYGDGLFETIRIHRGRPLFLQQHLQRLANGCVRLGMASAPERWREWIGRALQDSSDAGVLKVIVTRGSGGRGYRPPEPATPRCIISLHALPAAPEPDPARGCSAFVCAQRLALQPALAGLKHLNRLEQVLASREFPDASWHEGLMLDTEGRLIEGTRSNVFVAVEGRLLTPALTRCGVAGVMREQLMAVFGARVAEADLPAAVLEQADELFICNSVLGIWPVARLRHAGGEQAMLPGAFALEAQDWLAGVLAA